MKAFNGYWRITWMREWDEDCIDLVQPGYFRLDDDPGAFGFGAVTAEIGARFTHDGHRVDFSWSGMDEGDEASRRGWFTLTDVNTAEERLFFHLGDDCRIGIQRQN